MSSKLSFEYGIYRLFKNGNRVDEQLIISDIYFIQKLYENFNVLPEKTFDDFLEILYSKGESTIIGKLTNIVVCLLLEEIA
tara:strand:- start:506 stop:748 length:243 start_codon:yes stop_codon:yes gene_type:complete